MNPSPRDRHVVVNSRLKNAMDVSRGYLDRYKARHLHEDLDETQLDDNGDLDGGPEKMRTQISDSLGYLLFQRFGSPVNRAGKGLQVSAL